MRPWPPSSAPAAKPERNSKLSPPCASSNPRAFTGATPSGARHAHKRELDDEAVAGADVIVVDSVEQSRQEAGDLIIAFQGDEICWTGVKKLSDVVAGKVSGRTSDTEVTLFKSNGIASWDLAVAMRVYAQAREQGLGRSLPFWS